jgi:hypothetical protein
MLISYPLVANRAQINRIGSIEGLKISKRFEGEGLEFEETPAPYPLPLQQNIQFDREKAEDSR